MKIMNKLFSRPSDDTLFQRRQWGRLKYDVLGSIEALLHPEERKIMCWMAAQIYRGEGVIVDAGAFLGGSARSFAEGLSENPAIEDATGLIHSYDLFRKGNWLRNPMPLWDGVENGRSTMQVFHEQLGPRNEMVTIYPGDILKRSWQGGPIEFLMLDCSKTQALNDHCMRMFFPSLIPGVSYLVHQDYAIKSGLYWLHASMYLLRDYFEHIVTVNHGGTTIFRCIKEIPAEVIEEVVAAQSGDLMAIRDAALAEAQAIGQEKHVVAITASFQNAPGAS